MQLLIFSVYIASYSLYSHEIMIIIRIASGIPLYGCKLHPDYNVQ